MELVEGEVVTLEVIGERYALNLLARLAVDESQHGRLGIGEAEEVEACAIHVVTLGVPQGRDEGLVSIGQRYAGRMLDEGVVRTAR